jgi:tRNA-splicing ligase RtcB
MAFAALSIDPGTIQEVSPCVYEIPIGFVPRMRVPGRFYATHAMAELAFGELNGWIRRPSGALPSIMQIAFVATLPGIAVGSFGMPDMHSGYGFSIGGVAAFDTCDPSCVISPGGVGYDINCGVRLMTTGLRRKQVERRIKDFIDELSRQIPVGVGGKRRSFNRPDDIFEIAEQGARWASDHGFGVPADLASCEENGCISFHDRSLISDRAAARVRPDWYSWLGEPLFGGPSCR